MTNKENGLLPEYERGYNQGVLDTVELHKSTYCSRAQPQNVEGDLITLISECTEYAKRDWKEGAFHYNEREIVVDTVRYLHKRGLLSHPKQEPVGDGFLNQLAVVSRAFEKLEDRKKLGDLKEVIEWLDDAFADIADSRERMGKSNDVLDRCERVLNTIRALTAQQPDVNQELLEALKLCVACLPRYSNKYDVATSRRFAKQALANAEQKGKE